MAETLEPKWKKWYKGNITPTERKQGVTEYWFLEDGSLKYGPSPNAVFYTKARTHQGAIEKFWSHKNSNKL